MPKKDIGVDQDPERTLSKSSSLGQIDNRKDSIQEYFGDISFRTNPFGSNISLENGYKRAERIMAAVHLMTSHIEHSEPLRANLRSESICLIGYMLKTQGELRAIGSEHVRNMQTSIRKLISLTSLAGIAGRVSHQNAHIIVEALDDLGSFLISAQRSTLAESVALTRDDLVPRSSVVKREERRSVIKPLPRNIVKDNLNVKDIVRKEPPSEARSSRIMEVLSRGGLLGIKDITAILPEYSEKMVQRDLASLAIQGRVRKVGEKRWSKYEIVQ